MPLSNVVSIAFGVALIALGVAFLRRHRRIWQVRQSDEALTPDERGYYTRQHHRRMLTSGLIVLLGVLIPAGDLLFTRKPPPPPLALTLFWIGVLLVVLWVLLLGVIDLFATGLHANDAMSRVNAEKAALEHQLEEIRRTLREDGGSGSKAMDEFRKRTRGKGTNAADDFRQPAQRRLQSRDDVSHDAQ